MHKLGTTQARLRTLNDHRNSSAHERPDPAARLVQTFDSGKSGRDAPRPVWPGSLDHSSWADPAVFQADDRPVVYAAWPSITGS
jgi:hypothetical protein